MCIRDRYNTVNVQREPDVPTSGPLTITASDSLAVDSGKTLNLETGVGITVEGDASLTVDGTLNGNSIDNAGTITVNSANTLYVTGNFANNGTIEVTATGRVVVGGTFTSTGTLSLTEGAKVLSKGGFGGIYLPANWYETGTESYNGSSYPALEYTPAHEVTFDCNGGAWEAGENVNTLSTGAGGKLASGSIPADPVLAGSGFIGWFTTANGGTQIDPANHAFTADTTLYARWTPYYTITFDGNGGKVDGQGTQIHFAGEDGMLTSQPTELTRTVNTDGTATYTFGGWFTAAEGGTEVTAGTVFTKDTTVYAHWTMSATGWDWEYTDTAQTALRIFGTGAMTDFAASSPSWADSASASTITSVTVEEGITSVGMTAFAGLTSLTTVALPEGLKAINSYAFNNCSSLTEIALPSTLTSLGTNFAFAGCTKLDNVVIPSKVTAIPQYTFQGCTGLTTVTIPASVKTVSAEAFDGCTGLREITFGGTKAQWNAFSYKAPGGVTVTCSDGILLEYVVTFDSQGGSAVAPQRVDKGGTATKPADPTRTGYAFGGWSLDGATAYDFSTPVTGNIALTAMWTPLRYTVTFNSDGGSAVDSQTVSYGSTVTKPTDPTKTSKLFDGWYTDQTYQTEFSFDTPVTQDVTVYALWMNYSVTFDPSGGIGGAMLMVDDSGVLTELPTPPSKSGKTFSGWNTAEDGSGTPISQDALSTYKFTENTTLYAQWN